MREGMDFHGMDFKTVLVISQVLGYMLSKFAGIKLVSVMTSTKRATSLVALVGFSLLMLLAFAVLPVNFKPYALFLNGMPLGMVFGLVFSYLEGRKKYGAPGCGFKRDVYLLYRICEDCRCLADAGIWCGRVYHAISYGVGVFSALSGFSQDAQ